MPNVPRYVPRYGERVTWEQVRELAEGIRDRAHRLGDDWLAAEALIRTAQRMLAQLDRGVHVNPELVTVLANPGAHPRRKIGEHAQLLAYIHAESGDPYVHAFGDGERALEVDRRGIVRGVDLDALDEESGVALYAVGRNLLLTRPDGQELSADL